LNKIVVFGPKMWNVLDKFAENVRVYSTPVGQVWNIINFVFRLFVIAAVGSSVYGDEQGAFKCDTGQPGCQNVCFNRFSPISHMRFWSFQLLFVSTPCLFFYMYASLSTGRVKKLEAEKEKLKKNKEEIDEATKVIMNEEPSESDPTATTSANSPTGEEDENQQALIKDQDNEAKSQAAWTQYYTNTDELKKTEKRVAKLQKKVGRYKEREVTNLRFGDKGSAGPGDLEQIIFTTKVRVMYILHCLMKIGVELLFLYLGYILQQQQSKTTGLKAWTVPEKYVCTHALEYGAAGSACAQQEKVTCWVSRPFEKRYFLWYMIVMTLLSILVTVIETFYMIFRTTRKSVQRKANDGYAQKRNNDNKYFVGYDASNFQNFDNTMMTNRSQRAIRNQLQQVHHNQSFMNKFS